ncbi:hypothetical protein CHS0354_030631 [Potamilus streckersoni]|uniref:Uncharacterized protein n=1 Tax=Potamilus streckersoni TaxID=2493646 RepID=A0AAE0SD38_9BIVA|nr:hypothetical protein CHS0354_030631 [Potamilus streckersoni]
MTACVNLSLLFFILCVCAAKADITKASLDGPESVCNGYPFEIKEGNELQLVSKGLVQKSMCSVRMNVQRSQNCRGVCFNLRSSNFADCSAKLITTEIHFGELVPDVIQEENCQKSMEVPWCSSAHTLKLDIVLDDMVMTPKYNFSATVYPRCGDDVVYRPPSINVEEGVRIALIHGLLVGICTCLVFIVIFFSAWCYYRNRPNSGRTMSPSASKEKTPGQGGKQSSSADQKGTFRKINEREKEEAKHML